MDARAKTGVSIRSAAKRYGQVVALDDVSLDIAPGKFVSLLTPSGSGKTTLPGMLGGFVQPSSGAVWVGERDITFAPPHSKVGRADERDARPAGHDRRARLIFSAHAWGTLSPIHRTL